MVPFPVIQIIPQIPDFEKVYCICSDSFSSSGNKNFKNTTVIYTWFLAVVRKPTSSEKKRKRKWKGLSNKSPPYGFPSSKSGSGFTLQPDKNTKKEGKKHEIMVFKELDIRQWESDLWEMTGKTRWAFTTRNNFQFLVQGRRMRSEPKRVP